MVIRAVNGPGPKEWARARSGRAGRTRRKRREREVDRIAGRRATEGKEGAHDAQHERASQWCGELVAPKARQGAFTVKDGVRDMGEWKCVSINVM